MTVLYKKSIFGVFWSALDVFLRYGVQFAILIALSRILSPSEFAVMAILSVFTTVAGAFIDGGFSAALIQRQITTATDESTVFFFNLAMAVAVTALLCFSAPWLAKLFNQAILQDLSYAMAVNLFVNALGSVHTALLTKELDFKTISKIGAVSSFFSGTAAVAAAMQGLGVWSLVIQALTASVISVLLLWAWHTWRPVWTFSMASLRSLFRFGSYLLITAVLDALYRNLYAVLIGKFYTAPDVGFYDRAQKTNMLPVNLMMMIINRVAYSTFSSFADDPKTLGRGLRKAQQMVMFVNIPVMMAMAVLAQPIVLILFGGQWLPCVPILQVLCIAGVLWPSHMLNLIVLKAQGRSDLYFNITLIKIAIAIALTVYGSFYSIMAIAWAQVGATFISFGINAHYSKVFLDYGAFKQLRDLSPYFAASIPAGLSMWLIMLDSNFPVYIALTLALVTSTVLYLLACRLLRTDALSEILGLLVKAKSP